MDIEVLDLLCESDIEWNRYISKKKHDIVDDLSFLILKDKNLCNRIFINCDFTGIQFEFINFDKSIFKKCKFENSSVSYSSFVDCEFSNCTFSNDIIHHTVFRNTEVKQCLFDKEQMWDIDALFCQIRECTITGSYLKKSKILDSKVYITCLNKSVMRDININSCSFQDISITRYVLRTFQIVKTLFDECSFCDGIIHNGSTGNSVFYKSKFYALRAKTHNLDKCEIKQSQMIKLNLKEWCLSETIYVGTHFENCIWPDMNYKISKTGALRVPDHLPVTPIQDMSGVDPIMRRTIRDSQYLDYKNKKCHNIVKKFFFCCWGITSGYGQSIGRLFTTLLGGTLIIAIIGIVKDNIIKEKVDWNQIFQYIFSVYLKVIDADSIFNVILDPGIVVIAQMFGLVWFGLLVGVVGTKLTQLGAD